jgi:hypothetical protein
MPPIAEDADLCSEVLESKESSRTGHKPLRDSDEGFTSDFCEDAYIIKVLGRPWQH